MSIFRKKKTPGWDFPVMSGIIIGRPETREKKKVFLTCLPKGILVFLAVFGSLGGFLDAFDVAYYQEFVAGIFLVVALYFSGLFALPKSWHKDVGYIIYFIFYVMGIYMYRSYVNSGFAVILNEVRQQGEVYFAINAGNEFSESMEDREMAATMAILFIGMFEIILLNIFISNYMSLKLTAFVTLPIFVFAMYFQQEPGMGYVLCLLGGLMGIYVFKNSGHFIYDKGRQDYVREKKSKIPGITYTQNNRVYGYVLISVLAAMFVIGVASLFFDADEFRRYYKENEYKAATRDGISGFLMMGWRIFYPQGYSWSGMSEGNLRDAVAVRPDDSVHLVVRYEPYTKERIYLKGYTGKNWDGEQWGEDTGDWFMEPNEDNVEFIWQDEVPKRGMEVEVENANLFYRYMPYFTLEEIYTYFAAKDKEIAEYWFCPEIGPEVQLPQGKTPKEYLSIPDSCQEVLEEFVRKTGLSKNHEDVVQRVVDYLDDEYEYSYTPGKVPRNRDPLEYFIKDNRKGVCMHFASAATLMFRKLGIPARYAEGYAIDEQNVLAGKDWNEKANGKEVEVPGGNAHAWVEIYQEGKGWMVVDPTPASFQMPNDSGVLNSLQEMWAAPSDINATGWIRRWNLEFLKSNAVQVVMVLVALVAAMVWVMRIVARQIRCYQNWHTQDLRKNMLWYYRQLCQKMAKRDANFAKLTMPSKQFAYLAENYQEKKQREWDMLEVQRIFSEICFSDKQPRQQEYDMVMNVLKQLKKCR